MARNVNVPALLILLFLSCLSASPTKSSTEEISTEQNLPCLMELQQIFNNILFKLFVRSVEPFDLPQKMDPNTASDRYQTKQSSASESSSESFEHVPHEIAEAVIVLLGRLDLLMENLNRTMSSSACLKHYQPKNPPASHVGKLQDQLFFNCETSPLICMALRMLHWIYVEPTYKLLQLLRHWINAKSINSGMI
ncbi:uncharacterized protein LOC118502361 [Anopheles stephensi]|uniref:uncharacterized protein LOC118502361 n=1 Tax=Anopheles stephensi TaxID=30069 RepID=UPI0007D500EF|nr:uncharacterized protein LOC118502361 [Anopheles stephensi]